MEKRLLPAVVSTRSPASATEYDYTLLRPEKHVFMLNILRFVVIYGLWCWDDFQRKEEEIYQKLGLNSDFL